MQTKSRVKLLVLMLTLLMTMHTQCTQGRWVLNGYIFRSWSQTTYHSNIGVLIRWGNRIRVVYLTLLPTCVRACSLVINTWPHNGIVSGSVREPNPRVQPNRYCTSSGISKTLPTRNYSSGLLQPNFQLLYKKINHQTPHDL